MLQVLRIRNTGDEEKFATRMCAKGMCSKGARAYGKNAKRMCAKRCLYLRDVRVRESERDVCQ
jgi:hypothetical protein